MALSELTYRQREVYEFIRERIEAGVPPTFREIADRFGIVSPNGVAYHLKALERKGMIVRDPNLSRGIRLTKQPQRHGMPLFRSIRQDNIADFYLALADFYS